MYFLKSDIWLIDQILENGSGWELFSIISYVNASLCAHDVVMHMMLLCIRCNMTTTFTSEETNFTILIISGVGLVK